MNRVKIVSFLSHIKIDPTQAIPDSCQSQYYSFTDSYEFVEFVKQNHDQICLLIIETSYTEVELKLLRRLKKQYQWLQILLLSLNEEMPLFNEFAKLGLVSTHCSPVHPALIRLDIELTLDRVYHQGDCEEGSDFECAMVKRLGIEDEASDFLSEQDFLAQIHDSHCIKEEEKKKLLIIEDEYELNQNLVQWLNQEGYQCSSVLTGNDALNAIRSNPDIDLILLDIGLPDETGDTIIKAIKDLVPRVRIVVLSAYKDKDLIVTCMREGANAYINKPFSQKELIDALKTESQYANLWDIDKGVWLDSLLSTCAVNR